MAATEDRCTQYRSVKQSLHLLYILENDILFEEPNKAKTWQPQRTGVHSTGRSNSPYIFFTYWKMTYFSKSQIKQKHGSHRGQVYTVQVGQTVLTSSLHIGK